MLAKVSCYAVYRELHDLIIIIIPIDDVNDSCSSTNGRGESAGVIFPQGGYINLMLTPSHVYVVYAKLLLIPGIDINNIMPPCMRLVGNIAKVK